MTLLTIIFVVVKNYFFCSIAHSFVEIVDFESHGSKYLQNKSISVSIGSFTSKHHSTIKPAPEKYEKIGENLEPSIWSILGKKRLSIFSLEYLGLCRCWIWERMSPSHMTYCLLRESMFHWCNLYLLIHEGKTSTTHLATCLVLICYKDDYTLRVTKE